MLANNPAMFRTVDQTEIELPFLASWWPPLHFQYMYSPCADRVPPKGRKAARAGEASSRRGWLGRR
jgi:hypothetical protein